MVENSKQAGVPMSFDEAKAALEAAEGTTYDLYIQATVDMIKDYVHVDAGFILPGVFGLISAVSVGVGAFFNNKQAA